jgi:hypothetical protein
MALIRLFSVEADKATGEWIGQPEQIGTIEEESLHRQPDTEHDHWNTFEMDGWTVGVRVIWVGEG